MADDPSGSGQGARESSGRAILVIEDQDAVARALTIALRLAGHRVEVAPAPVEAYSLLAQRRFDAILLDLNFAPGETDGAAGLACLSRLLADDPAACVLVITAHSGVRIAVDAMRSGARDFVMKPWRNAELVDKVEQAIARVSQTRTVTPMSTPLPMPRLLGECAAIRQLRALIVRVAPTSAGVTISGPAGSGRTLAARTLHAASGDASPAVQIDLRDAAAWQKIEAAGTVILRHADRLDVVAQARLLERLVPALRCIAVVDEVGALTPALRHRVATVELAMPPLAMRGEDAVLLAHHFARSAAERYGRPPVTLSEAAEQAVRETRWRDDVRGLATAVERAVLLAGGVMIDGAALSPAPRASGAAETSSGHLAATERAMIAAALREHRHNVTQAAAALGLSRAALYRRMARYGL